ncbi:MAG: hypothetical protein ABIZ73_02700, partial [Gemmatimonadaceae bacterium]
FDVEAAGILEHRRRPLVRIADESNAVMFENRLVTRDRMRRIGRLVRSNDAVVEKIVGLADCEHLANCRGMAHMDPAKKAIAKQERLPGIIQSDEPYRRRVM